MAGADCFVAVSSIRGPSMILDGKYQIGSLNSRLKSEHKAIDLDDGYVVSLWHLEQTGQIQNGSVTIMGCMKFLLF